MTSLVLDKNEEDGILTFTISNINVSYANAIRRTILADIPTVVFETIPHEKNNSTFYINTSKLNNEILKQRLSCIPIHIDDLEMPLEDYILEIDVKNNSDNIIYVTTRDFKIKNLKTGKYLNSDLVNTIFPPNNITNQYIDFCRLNNKISETIPGEQLKLTCKFSISKASENSSFNVVSMCTYRNTPDYSGIDEQELIKREEFREKLGDDEESIEFQLQDWRKLDAKRIVLSDSFDFKIESIGVFKNIDIVKNSIVIIVNRLKNIESEYLNNPELIKNSNTTIENSFDIILQNEDFTIGKILEFTLYDNYYQKQQLLTFCGFRKEHPHTPGSTIRIAFSQETSKELVVKYLINSANIAIDFYMKLLKEF